MEKSNCYCIYFRKLAKELTSIYNSRLEPLGISITQYSLLRGLEDLERSSITRLAQHLELERTTLTRTIKPLLDKGLIQNLSSNPKSKSLSLSPDGKILLELAKPIWLSIQLELERKLGLETLQATMENFKKL